MWKSIDLGQFPITNNGNINVSDTLYILQSPVWTGFLLQKILSLEMINCCMFVIQRIIELYRWIYQGILLVQDH